MSRRPAPRPSRISRPSRPSTRPGRGDGGYLTVGVPCAGTTSRGTPCGNQTRNVDRWCRQCQPPGSQMSNRAGSAPTAPPVIPGAVPGPPPPRPVTPPPGVPAGRPLDPGTLTLNPHAQARFVLRWGGTLEDADANLTSLLAPHAGTRAPLIRYIEEDGSIKWTRHYPVGQVIAVLNAANTRVITVLPGRHEPLEPGDAIPGLDPRTTRLTRNARQQLAYAREIPLEQTEALMRDALVTVKGRVAPLEGKDRPARTYLIDGLYYIVSADNRAVIAVSARKRPKRASEKVKKLTDEQMSALRTATPSVSRAAVNGFVKTHPGCSHLETGQIEAQLRIGLAAAARSHTITPTASGYKASFKSVVVYLSADLSTVTGYTAEPGSLTPQEWHARAEADEARWRR